jgi:hypothetical protein
MRPPGKLDGELGVLISLVVSFGMVILTVAGWWLVNTFPGLMGAVMSVRSVEMREKRRKELSELIRWIRTVASNCVVCCVCLVCLVGVVLAAQPDPLKEPVDWDVLPSGLNEVWYNRGGDGMGLHKSQRVPIRWAHLPGDDDQ